MLYKRIAGAENDDELEALTAEIVDRFGALPEPAQRLIEITRVKQRARALGIERIQVGTTLAPASTSAPNPRLARTPWYV